MAYEAKDLNYRGENCGVHNWITETGQSFYWHPDWIHIAEDETGLHGKHGIDVKKDNPVTKDDAIHAILKKLNEMLKNTNHE